MRARIANFMARRRQIKAAERALNQLAQLPCNSHALWKITEPEVSKIFTSPEMTEAWTKAQPALSRAGSIEDGITDGINPGDRRVLWHLIRSLAPTSILEIGTHVGASTMHIASAMLSLAQEGAPSTPHLTTVDIDDVNSEVSGEWKKRGLDASPQQRLDAMGCRQLVSFVTESSLTFLDQCKNKFDFIFLDGDHGARAVYQEVPRALNLLNENGVILLHDYFPENKPLWVNGVVIPGPHLAVTRLRREGARIKVIPVGTVPWTTKLGSNRTSLAVLTRDS